MAISPVLTFISMTAWWRLTVMPPLQAELPPSLRHDRVMKTMTKSPRTGAAPTAEDRCDACSARAAVRVWLPSERFLLFCKHHYNDHESALVAFGAMPEVGA